MKFKKLFKSKIGVAEAKRAILNKMYRYEFDWIENQNLVYLKLYDDYTYSPEHSYGTLKDILEDFKIECVSVGKDDVFVAVEIFFMNKTFESIEEPEYYIWNKYFKPKLAIVRMSSNIV